MYCRHWVLELKIRVFSRACKFFIVKGYHRNFRNIHIILRQYSKVPIIRTVMSISTAHAMYCRTGPTYCSYNGNFRAGIYILKRIRNYTKIKVQNGETLPKLNIGIYSKFDQYYRYNIIMYDFIHIIQFLIPIWSWISKMMQENATFFTFLLELWPKLYHFQ